MFPSRTFFVCCLSYIVQLILDHSGKRAMATKLVCLLISSYLLLAGDYHVVSGFTPVTYSSQSSTAECGHSDPLQDDQLIACSDQSGPSTARSSRMQPFSKQILSGYSPLLPISSLRLPRDTCSQWLTSTGLL